MKVYLAAPWVWREEAQKLAEWLAHKGYFVTHDWWNHETSWSDHETLAIHAQKDVTAVSVAEVVIVLDYEKSEGKAVEQGIALTLKKPIILVHKEGVNNLNVFHHLPYYVHVNNYEEMFRALEVMQVCLS